jgi:hypothetical protein
MSDVLFPGRFRDLADYYQTGKPVYPRPCWPAASPPLSACATRLRLRQIDVATAVPAIATLIHLAPGSPASGRNTS